ncbi:MAG TPA: TIGR03067 domain-containing protein [Gemmataceae bacterium]|jgi:uncharacterized protein (TIGR03067 family)|nr:TIGR03067 domain-containing protein [Gemmataceae bacterium]
MKRFCGLTIVLAVAILASPIGWADEKNDLPEKELKAFEGNWQCKREEGGGRLTPEVIVSGFRLIIEGEKYQTIYGGKTKGSAANIIKLDPTATPKTIDVEWTSGSWKDQKQLGIYKLDGDKLEICWAEVGGKTRPKKFTTTPGVGAGNMYMKYVREKD